jgi:hypothetical protein
MTDGDSTDLAIALTYQSPPRPVIAVFPDGRIKLHGSDDAINDAFTKLATAFARALARTGTETKT